MATKTETKYVHEIEPEDISLVNVIEPGDEEGFEISVRYACYEADGDGGSKTTVIHSNGSRIIPIGMLEFGTAIFLAAGVDPTPKSNEELRGAFDALRQSIVDSLNAELGF